MNAHVSLLRDAERRYQGPVSQAFMVRGALALLAVLVAGLGGGMIVRHAEVRQRLRSAQEEWSRTEPRYQKLLAVQGEIARNRALLTELDGWKTARLEGYFLLSALQELVPPTVQFTRLGVRSEIVLVKEPEAEKPKEPEAPARKAPAGKAGDAAAAEKAGPKSEAPGLPARKYIVNINGKAVGERAEEEVGQFERALRESPVLEPVFESVKLLNLSRASSLQEQDAGSRFELECITAPRIIK